MQSARELPGELFHASNRRQLRHVLLQHFEIFEQQSPLVRQSWLKRFAAVYGVLDLSEDPWVGHRAAADQDAVTVSIAKSIERLLDGRNIAAAGNRNLHGLLDLPHQLPVRQTAVSLLLGPTVQGNVFDAAVFSQFRGLDGIDG